MSTSHSVPGYQSNTDNILPLACGSLVQVPPGISRTIKSPNFPGLYSSGADCLWTVVGRHRFFSAQIRLPTLVTEASKDIVSIIEPLDDRTTKSKFSGRTQSQTVKITNSPGFSIAFTSDASVTYKGFKIVISGHPEGEVSLNVRQSHN